jgi:hypothetical protein
VPHHNSSRRIRRLKAESTLRMLCPLSFSFSFVTAFPVSKWGVALCRSEASASGCEPFGSLRFVVVTLLLSRSVNDGSNVGGITLASTPLARYVLRMRVARSLAEGVG